MVGSSAWTDADRLRQDEGCGAMQGRAPEHVSFATAREMHLSWRWERQSNQSFSFNFLGRYFLVRY